MGDGCHDEGTGRVADRHCRDHSSHISACEDVFTSVTSASESIKGAGGNEWTLSPLHSDSMSACTHSAAVLCVGR